MLTRRTALFAAPLLVAAPPLRAAERAPVDATPQSRLETPWWRERHAQKLALVAAHPDAALVWLGDSITQFWEKAGPEDWQNFAPIWNRYYPGAINLGFTGDTTSHLLWRMENGELNGLHPKAAVILIGANNLGRLQSTAARTVAGIEAVVDEARRRLPGTRILLLSVLPSVRNTYVDRTTLQINYALAQHFAADAVPSVTFKDVTSLYMRDGRVDRTQFLDDRLSPPQAPIHPTAQSHAKLADALAPILSQMMR